MFFLLSAFFLCATLYSGESNKSNPQGLNFLITTNQTGPIVPLYFSVNNLPFQQNNPLLSQQFSSLHAPQPFPIEQNKNNQSLFAMQHQALQLQQENTALEMQLAQQKYAAEQRKNRELQEELQKLQAQEHEARQQTLRLQREKEEKIFKKTIMRQQNMLQKIHSLPTASVKPNENKSTEKSALATPQKRKYQKKAAPAVTPATFAAPAVRQAAQRAATKIYEQTRKREKKPSLKYLEDDYDKIGDTIFVNSSSSPQSLPYTTEANWLKEQELLQHKQEELSEQRRLCKNNATEEEEIDDIIFFCSTDPLNITQKLNSFSSIPVPCNKKEKMPQPQGSKSPTKEKLKYYKKKLQQNGKLNDSFVEISPSGKYVCLLCQKNGNSFETSRLKVIPSSPVIGIQNHFSTTHPDKAQLLYKCTKCPTHFSDNAQWHTHVIAHNNSIEEDKEVSTAPNQRTSEISEEESAALAILALKSTPTAIKKQNITMMI